MVAKAIYTSDVATLIDKSNSIRLFISDVAIGKTPKEASYSDVAEGAKVRISRSDALGHECYTAADSASVTTGKIKISGSHSLGFSLPCCRQGSVTTVMSQQ